MNPSSPVKRRVLGALDPNTSSPKPHSQQPRDFHPPQQVFKAPALPRSSSATICAESGSLPKLVAPSQTRSAETPEPYLPQLPSSSSLSSASTIVPDAAERKRSVGEMTPRAERDEPARKRPCLDGAVEPRFPRLYDPEAPIVADDTDDRRRSLSPDASSVFDNSAIDTSQATAVTEPDVEPAPAAGRVLPRPAPRTLTREETRQKMETLRLRLGLANYKVRTGQTDVPLERLQMRRVPPSHRSFDSLVSGGGAVAGPVVLGDVARSIAEARRELLANKAARRPLPDGPSARRGADAARVGRPTSAPNTSRHESAATEANGEHDVAEEADGLPKLPQQSVFRTPRKTRGEGEERLSSSALRGGAASGLLSLSRS